MALAVILIVCILYFAQGQAKDDFSNDEPVQYYKMGKVDLLYTKLQKQQLKTRSAYLTIVKWPNKIIPYTVSSVFRAIPSRMPALRQAIQDYNDYTCIRFVNRTNERNYVKFINGQGCYSYLGVIGGEQPISYGEGCDSTRGTPLHEIMHALGFMHEQQRPDRDSYVTINMQNVEKGTEENFRKANRRDVNLLRNYDLNSVMHYPRWAFSTNGQDTITTKDGSQRNKIGQRKFFSRCDIAKINQFYNCGSNYITSC